MENNTPNPSPTNQNNETPETNAQAPGEQVNAAPQQPQQPQVNEAPKTEEAPVAPAPSVTNAPASSPLAAPSVGSSDGGHKKFATIAVGLVALVVGLAIGFVGAAATGTSFVKEDNSTKVATPAVNQDKELAVPEGAEVINECAKGRGKQYVLPKDLPMGPVYNVWDGKVTSIEYMPGQAEVLANENFMNLDLENVKYDHINIGLLSQGHTGYPDPHYHVDVFTITAEEANAITCE